MPMPHPAHARLPGSTYSSTGRSVILVAIAHTSYCRLTHSDGRWRTPSAMVRDRASRGVREQRRAHVAPAEAGDRSRTPREPPGRRRAPRSGPSQIGPFVAVARAPCRTRRPASRRHSASRSASAGNGRYARTPSTPARTPSARSGVGRDGELRRDASPRPPARRRRRRAGTPRSGRPSRGRYASANSASTRGMTSSASSERRLVQAADLHVAVVHDARRRPARGSAIVTGPTLRGSPGSTIGSAAGTAAGTRRRQPGDGTLDRHHRVRQQEAVVADHHRHVELLGDAVRLHGTCRGSPGCLRQYSWTQPASRTDIESCWSLSTFHGAAIARFATAHHDRQPRAGRPPHLLGHVREAVGARRGEDARADGRRADARRTAPSARSRPSRTRRSARRISTHFDERARRPATAA